MFLRAGRIYEPAFAHFEGEGIGCDDYHDDNVPGSSWPGASEPVDAAVEVEDSDKLTLLLRTEGSAWSVVLGIDEMSAGDARSTTLAALKRAELRIAASGLEVGRINAISVRHGVRRADVDVPPSAGTYQVVLAGDWPPLGFTHRRMQTAGTSLRGTFFRSVGGEWVRIPGGARVVWGQEMFFVASQVSAPPPGCAARAFDVVHAGGTTWQLWHLVLPYEPAIDIEQWLSGTGHSVAAPSWRLSLVSIPRGLTDDRSVQLYVGDPLLATISGPAGESVASLILQTRSREAALTLETSAKTFAVARPPAGRSTLRIEAEDEVARSFNVVPRPTLAQLQSDFARLPQLVVRLGQRSLAAARHAVRLPRSQRTVPVTITTGVDGARVSLLIQSATTRRILFSITPAEAARTLTESLAREDVDMFQIDAGALGSCIVSLAATASDQPEARNVRLAGWLSSAARADGRLRRPLTPWSARAASKVRALCAVAVAGTTSTTRPSLDALLRRRHSERGS